MRKMNKEEVLSMIMKAVEVEEWPINSFYDYLIGAVDEEAICIKKIEVRHYWQISRLCFSSTQPYDEEVQAIIHRLIYILSERAPDVLMLLDEQYPSSCRILKEAGVKEAFINQDCMNRLKEQFGYSTYHANDSEFSEWLSDIKKYYPKCVTYFLNQQPMANEGEQLATLIFMVNEVRHNPKGEYRITFQKWMLSLMTMTFGVHKVGGAYKECGSYKEIESILKNPIPIKLTRPKDVLFYLCECLVESEDSLKEMARLTMFLLDMRFFRNYQRYRLGSQRIALWDQLEVPKELYLRYYCESLNLSGISSIQESCEEIKALVKEDETEAIAILEKQLKENEIYGINLLAMMLAHQLLSKDQASNYLASADGVLMAEISAIFKAAEKEMVFEPGVEVLLAELSKAEFDSKVFSKYEGSFICKEDGFYKWGLAAIGLMEYSTVANNVVKFLLSHLSTYSLLRSCFSEKYLYYSQLEIKLFLEHLYDKGFRLQNLIKVVLCQYCVDSYDRREVIIDQTYLYDFLLKHQDELEQLMQEVPYDTEMMIYLLKLLFQKTSDFNDKMLVGFLKNKDKKIVLAVEKLLLSREHTIREEVEAISRGKGKVSIDAARRLLHQWENDRVDEKLRDIKTIQALEDFIAKEYTKAHEKNVPYKEVVDYKQVREKDGENYVSKELMKYFVAEYIMLKDFYVIKTCSKISSMVNPYDLQNLLQQLYMHWVAEGASNTYKNIMFPYSLLATPTQLTALKKQIDEWSTKSKPALAAFGVQCLCMNGSKLALLWTDNLSKKHKNKKVRQAAVEAMDMLCKAWQMSRDALEDEIVPDFGFDSQRVRYFDYGQRKMKAILNQDLSIDLLDETGKTIRSLPKASEKYGDVEEMVSAAKEELKAIKSQLPKVVEEQVLRITKAIFTGRCWSLNKWKSLFVVNPLMMTFATGLIWEERDQEGQLRGTFRYMEDGTFNDVEEEEYGLEEGSTIALLHPADLLEEQIKAWQTQLDDYEVQQPIAQFTLCRGELEEDLEEAQELSVCKGKQVYAATLKSIATKLGFSLCYGEYGDRVCIYFYHEISGILMTMVAELLEVGNYKQMATLSTFKFQEEEEYMSLRSIPKRLLSLGYYVGDELAKKALEVNVGE